MTEAIKDPQGMKAYAQAAGAAMGGVSRGLPDGQDNYSLPAGRTGLQQIIVELDDLRRMRQS